MLGRLREGARLVGAHEVWRCGLEPGAVPERLAVSDLRPGGTAVLYVVPDLSGAVLASDGGYVLVAGTSSFLAGAVPVGVDRARHRFGRVARRLAGRYPELPRIAAEYPALTPVWAKRSEVPDDSGVARQLAVMESLVRGELSGSEFSRTWGAARQLSNARGERLQTPFYQALDHLFFVLEEYPIDPALRDPGDVTDEELLAEVRAVLRRLAAAEGYSFRGSSAREIQLYCRTGGLSAAVGFEALTAALPVEDRRDGEDWVSAEVGCRLEFSVVAPLISEAFLAAILETFPGRESARVAAADAIVTLRFSGDVAWSAVTEVWRAAKSLWDVVRYDDGAGIDVNLDEL